MRLCSIKHKRKNWLFADTPKGAEASAIAYSLVETAKANGLEPYGYIAQLLQDLPWYGTNPDDDVIDTLLPWSKRMREYAMPVPGEEPPTDL